MGFDAAFACCFFDFVRGGFGAEVEDCVYVLGFGGGGFWGRGRVGRVVCLFFGVLGRLFRCLVGFLGLAVGVLGLVLVFSQKKLGPTPTHRLRFGAGNDAGLGRCDAQ